MAPQYGNGNGRAFKLFMACGTIFVSAGVGFLLWSFEAKVEQVVQKKLEDYVEIERYERELAAHDRWTIEKLGSIDDRFKRLESVGQERLDMLVSINTSLKSVVTDLKELRRSTNRNPATIP